MDLNQTMAAELEQSKIVLPGYQILEQLYSGPRTLVYRAICEASQQYVVIKLLRNKHPGFSELVQFRNQYAIARNLQIPGIVKPYRLEPCGNGYALILEDFGGKSLQHFASGRSLSLEQFWNIALQLVDILHALHQQRVIHKDIKPTNILIQPETQEVRLIDFSIASLLPRETQEIRPSGLEGTLAYLSPEQTGRMNRGIDYRSDFYSLGVTFYELLSGQLPFQSTDPMEVLHSHIAEPPRPVCHLNSAVPPMLGAIVHKLMAKNAEDRYQSALGLKHDLVTCQNQGQRAAELKEFELGTRDLCDRFLIPEKLYGREAEVKALLAAFERVSQGAAELVLVAGFSGVGKTAVVNEVQKPLVQQRGYFIKGKYDQFNRNVPLSAFVQALRDLMRQLLCESEAQLAQWRNRCLEALGENGQVLIEVIPELERIMGSQPPAPELSGSAAQNRFHRLFQKFVGLFATPEHPLVLFLDDLQWADSASLNLMQVLMGQQEVGCLLLIGAYRDNEVSSAHPLMWTIAEIVKTAIVHTLTLAPLKQSTVNCWVADALGCSAELALPLTQLIYPKTRGNPFFTTQFLRALYEDGWIRFDAETGSWQCDVAQVRSLALTDDVVEFMATQLQKLPAALQNVLKAAACIGTQFDLNTLAIVLQKSTPEAATSLWKALQEGWVIPQNQVYKFYQAADDHFSLQTSSPQTSSLQTSSSQTSSSQTSALETQPCVYKFLHDRVQQAAYSLIPAHQKQATHLQIGRLLLQATRIDQLEQRHEKLFAIVHHFNQGTSLIETAQEQQELAQLNLEAGRRARSAMAAEAALGYFKTGITLLGNDRWQHHYTLTLTLYQGAIESAYLNTDFEQVEQLAEVALSCAQSWLDRASIYVIKIQACIAQGQLLEALQLARQVLVHLDVPLPEQPTQAEVEQAFRSTQAFLQGRTIESLLTLPHMTAAKPKAAMVILSNIISAAYQVAPNLLSLIVFAHINLSVQYGNAPESTYGYVMYGLIQSSRLGEIEAGYRFGILGVNLLQHIQASKLYAKTIFGFHSHLSHWREPAKATLSGYLQAYTRGAETGDLEYVALSLLCHSYTAYFTGQELNSLKQTMEEHRKVIQQAGQNSYLRIQSIYFQTVLNLLDSTAEPDRLYSEHYDEEAMIQLHSEANQALALFQLYFCKLLLSYLFERYEQALENARLSEQYVELASGLLHIPLFYFYDALVQLAIYPTVSKAKQISLLKRVAMHQEKLSQWAVHAPSNQKHRCALVAAERCRVLGQKAKAIDLYDQAIAEAVESECIQEAAIANELAAKFYLKWGKRRVAQEYLIDAYYCYARWGAKAKILDLEARYPELLSPILQQNRSTSALNETVTLLETISSSSSYSFSNALDLATILKASQALSREIELDKLLSKLLQLIIENAGADRCVLLLRNNSQSDNEGGRLLVKGLAIVGAEPVVLQRIPIEESQDIPHKLVYAVKRRLEPILLADATAQAEFTTDPYFLRQQPKSILCSPILHQGELLGIVYLENNWAINAFTHDHAHILNLLCAQAAIALENARLYQRLQNHAQELEETVEKLRVSEARFQRMVDNVPGVVYQLRYETDGSTTTPYMSSGCLDLFGISPEDVISGVKDFRDMEYPDDRHAIEQAAIRATQTLTPFEQEARIITASGSIKWIQTTARPEQQADGTIVWDGVKLDITDRKQAEASLAKEREFLNAIVHNITDGIVVCDADGNLVLFNNAIREFHGLPVESSLPEQWAEHFDLYQSDGETPLPKDEVPLFRALQGEIVANAEIVIAPKQGSARFFWVSGQAIFDSSGNKVGAVVVMRDISDRKQAEQALQQKTKALEIALTNLQQAQIQIIQNEKMSALGNLVAGVAHEINNPIGFISGNLRPALEYIEDLFNLLDLYQQQYPEPGEIIQEELEAIDLEFVREDLPKLITSMKLGIDRIRDISTSLRTFSRTDKDYKVPFNIHDGIDSTILILKHRLRANSDRPAIEVVTNYGEIPEIECFPGQLNQVFMNILANAIDALEEASQGRTFSDLVAHPNQIEVQTQFNDLEEQVIIRIRDNGVGMTDEVKQHIFAHLFTTKGVGKGTGLGLAIAQQIVVEKHGGEIEVHSSVGQGTEFVIRLSV